MNLLELQAILDENYIQRGAYSFTGGLPDEQYCITRDDDLGWITYYSEKGSRNCLKAFATESEACEHFAQSFRENVSRWGICRLAGRAGAGLIPGGVIGEAWRGGKANASFISAAKMLAI